MALQKQPVSLNFAQGLNTKADPYQVPIGSFLQLENSVFTAAGRLGKRNGYADITTLPNALQTTLTTLNDNLIATGSNLYAYSQETNQWLDKGVVQPVQLTVQPLVRSSTSQTSPDAAVTSNGLICVTYVDSDMPYYQISDSTTGQQIVRAALPSSNPVVGGVDVAPRAFLLGQYFIVTFKENIGGNYHLRYVAIPTANPTNPGSIQDIATGLSSNAGYDGAVINNTLYLGWATAANSLEFAFLSQFLLLSAPQVITGHTASLMSTAIDFSGSTPVIWYTTWDATSSTIYTMTFNQALTPILAPTVVATGVTLTALTSIVQLDVLHIIYEIDNTYGSGPNTAVETDYLETVTVTGSGVVGTPTVVLRSVGLASKPFIDSINNTIYVLAAFGETNQPSYFLIDLLGNIYMRLAYSNGGGYAQNQVLATPTPINGSYLIPYLYKDFLATINKGTALPAGTPSNAIYTQTGVNLANISINTTGQHSSQIAGALFLTGGMVWEFDGTKPVELGFQVWPENQAATTANTSGHMSAQIYYYQITYEWTDGAGNLQRSAPSIPLLVDLSASGTSTNEVTLYIPTLRLTYKVAPNPVRIVIYRWSVAQQVYYQVTSITSPLLNDPTVDLVTYTDTLSDASILGNVIIYTTGGVVEDIAPPACLDSALFDNRLWIVDAEDPNLLWFSKQVIENVPVEMSDLLTVYIAPTSGAQGSTGSITALFPMDDKLIVFKKDAMYYINGTGPDNTGANSSYSNPIFITAAVGCINPTSIVLIPNGLMFQSDKGIWLLGRDLNTQYIGAMVEQYNSSTVMSAQAIPGTNQARFVLDGNITLMYDYYYNQWGTFSNIYAISSTLYQGADTYLNKFGIIYQETPGLYLDGAKPVLMSFTTGWINVAGLQGYERFYELFLLGTYFTPFKLNVVLAYNYNVGMTQQVLVTPDNQSPAWGGDPVWGSSEAWGGPGNIFSARVFPDKQKCESFRIEVSEVYDGSYTNNSGQGLTLSGLNLVVGVKRGWRTTSAAKSFG